MKKILLFMCLLLPTAVIAEDFGIKIPEWKDFSPSLYTDVKEPKKLAKFNTIANYWYKRRIEFENGIEDCKAKENFDEQCACFENLKIDQFKKNTDYNARIEAKETNFQLPEMQNQTDNMLPLNNYLNNFSKFQNNEML